MLTAYSHRSDKSLNPEHADTLPGPDEANAVLTPREQEIALLVAKGFSNKEVGHFLEISHWTVAAHLKSCYIKLGLRRRSELAYALRYLL